jgi:hypothetical protein
MGAPSSSSAEPTAGLRRCEASRGRPRLYDDEALEARPSGLERLVMVIMASGALA